MTSLCVMMWELNEFSSCVPGYLSPRRRAMLGSPPHCREQAIMITEIAQIDVKPGMEAEFETGVKNAAPVFKRAKGCHGLELAAFDRKTGPLSAVRQMGDRREPHRSTSAARPTFRSGANIVAHCFASPPEVEHVASRAAWILVHRHSGRRSWARLECTARAVALEGLAPSSRSDGLYSSRCTLAMRSGTPNSRRQTSASVATPARIASCEGLAKHSRVRLLPYALSVVHSGPGLMATPAASAGAIQFQRIDLVRQLDPEENAALRIVEFGRGAELLVERIHQRLELLAQAAGQLRHVGVEMRRAKFAQAPSARARRNRRRS